MAKVHPQLSPAVVAGAGEETAAAAAYMTAEEERESFTIWMRSLVFNSRGCTVFDSKGNIIYRVDNYDRNSCSDVYLMDLSGKILFTLRQNKKFGLLKSWEGYRSSEINTRKIDYFRVIKNTRVLSHRSSSSSSYKITTGSGRNRMCGYRIANIGSMFRVEDKLGRVVAEVKRKRSEKGLDLGEDVLTMNVDRQIDHSFVMGLVIAHSLIKCML